jgi:hypothetical protein
MKRAIVCLLVLLAGCQITSGDVGPDLLFRTWQTVTPAGIPDLQGQLPTQVEFTRAGTLLYGKDKQTGWCCSPARFKATSSQIEFLWAETPDPRCALIDCLASPLLVGVTWRIDKLTTSEMILTAGSRRLVFN